MQNYGTRKEMVSWSNLEKLCSCSRPWMVSGLACGNKWIQVGTYKFCTLESSLSVSSRDYYLISPFGSSLIKLVLVLKIRTTECTHQTTSVHRMNSWLILQCRSMCQPNHRSTRNKGIEHACYPVTQDHSEQYCAWTMISNSVHSIIYRS